MTDETRGAMQGTWTLIAPDGVAWLGDSPLRAVAAERDSRVPASVQVARVMAMVHEKVPRLFYYEEAVDAWVPADELEIGNIVDLNVLDDGEEIEVRFKRSDMTQAELDALPEV